jgi:hypothetical protein
MSEGSTSHCRRISSRSQRVWTLSIVLSLYAQMVVLAQEEERTNEAEPDEQTERERPETETPPARAKVVLVIRDDRGREVRGADIVLRPGTLERTTDGTGTVRFEEVPAGCTTVTVIADGFRTCARRFPVAPDQAPIIIELKQPGAGECKASVEAGSCSAD